MFFTQSINYLSVGEIQFDTEKNWCASYLATDKRMCMTCYEVLNNQDLWTPCIEMAVIAIVRRTFAKLELELELIQQRSLLKKEIFAGFLNVWILEHCSDRAQTALLCNTVLYVPVKPYAWSAGARQSLSGEIFKF